jgi:FKBP-type peptidyl-prolyl cis-trans isomerase FklB
MRTLWLIFLLGALNGYGQPPPQKNGKTASNPIALKGHADSVQYVLGSFVAQWLDTNGFKLSNMALFNKALEDFFQNRPRAVPDSLVPMLIEQYQLNSQKENALKQEQQLFSGLKDKQGVGVFPNGARYIVLQSGKGVRPAATDSIVLHLVAKLINGTVVEDTYRVQKPFEAVPDSFFPALSEALQMMAEGSKWQLYFPAVLAYGEKGTASIPPNSALVLDLELVQVKSKR